MNLKNGPVSSGKMPLLVVGLIALVGFAAFKDYLLLHKVFFFRGFCSDTLSFNYPFVRNQADYISKHGFPAWTFNVGMGQSTFAFCLRDPFDIFFYFPPASKHIFTWWIYKEFAKIILCGLVFYYYLKTLKLSDYTSLLGSLFFAYSGFMMIGSIWSYFVDEALWMTMLLLAFEWLLQKRGWRGWLLFAAAIFFIAISQPFNLYVFGVFLAAYAIIRLIQLGSFTVKNLAVLYAQMMGLGVIGLLLSGPFLLENIVKILESPRGSGSNSYASTLLSQPFFAIADKLQLCTAALRLFSNYLTGTPDHYKGWFNILEAPLFYCGLPCLLLMPQVFRFLSPRVKIGFIIFLAAWILPTIFPFFRYAFWLFSGDYYRAYAFFVAFFFIYYSLFALDNIIDKQAISRSTLIITLLALLALLNIPQLFGTSFLHSPEKKVTIIYLFVSVMLVLYTILMLLWRNQKNARNIKYIFLAAVVCEMAFSSHATLNHISEPSVAEISSRTGYNDYTIDAVKYLEKTDGSFYRIDKDYFSHPGVWICSPNDGPAQGYRGTGVYNSFNQGHYVKYLQLMGATSKTNEMDSRWVYGLKSRPILEAENRVKYFLAKHELSQFAKLSFDSIARFEDVVLYRNKYVLPFGYTYSNYVSSSEFDRLSNDQKDLLSLKACVLDDKDIRSHQTLKHFVIKDTVALSSYDTGSYRAAIAELSKDTMQIDEFKETRIKGSISLSEDKVMYLTIPFDKGWRLQVDGHRTEPIILNGGMTGVMLSKGQHSIELTFKDRYIGVGVILSLMGIVGVVALWAYDRQNKRKANTVKKAAYSDAVL